MTRLLAPDTTVAPAVRVSGPRTVPNLPGALTRQLSARLGVDATTAMRVALLYGDIEWLAGGKGAVAYSARDYARRHGLSRNTVLADLQRLVVLGALSASYDSSNGATYALHGLPWPAREQGEANDRDDPALLAGSAAGPELAQPLRHPEPVASPSPGSAVGPPPGSADRPPLAQPLRQGWLNASATIENSSKTLEKNKKRQEGSAEGTGSKAEGAAAPDGAAPAALLDRLLVIFRQGLPAEWSAPERITLSPERRSRLTKSLTFAGSSEALEQRLRSALAQVPPWYRQTYPQRPDGSRRPAHQFFDVLFRAAASERDCGVEAWHLFAWSEAACHQAGTGLTTTGSPAETELELAKSLFYWDSSLWCGIGIPALELSLSEKRRLTELLEAAGLGVAGTAARQYAETSPDASGTGGQAMPLWRTGGSQQATEPPSIEDQEAREGSCTAQDRPAGRAQGVAGDSERRPEASLSHRPAPPAGVQRQLPYRRQRPDGPRQAQACAGGRR